MFDQNELIEIKKGAARASHLEFIRWCWLYRNRPFLVGTHTKAICKKIDQCFNNFRNGITSYVVVLTCFRSGKSEITSRFMIPHFLAEFPDCETLVVSHSQALSNKFSLYSQSIIRNKSFQELYPKITLSTKKCSVEEWGIENNLGKAQYLGIESKTAGVGGHLIIVDDYFGNREEADSFIIREKRWDAFKDDIFSRRMEPAIVFICVTPWHTDDIVGRIQQEMTKNKDYPQYEIIKFPAFSEKYEKGILFPEKYSLEWYLSAKASLQSEYAYASLMQCDPILKSGNVFKTDKIHFYDDINDIYPEANFVRAWDTAASVKDVIKSDPDYTVGIKIAVKTVPSSLEGYDIYVIFIDDIIRGRWEALERDKTIISTAMSDGDIMIGAEAFGTQKDVYSIIKTILHGIRRIRKFPQGNDPRGDLMIRSSSLQTCFEVGNVYVRRATWNNVLLDELADFPSGSHDDIIAAMVVGFYTSIKTSGNKMYSYYNINNDKKIEEQKTEFCIERLSNMYKLEIEQDIYIRYIRKNIIKWLETISSINIITHTKSEISRLDLQHDYESFKVV